jgi:phosphomevalonate kinase
MKGLEAREFHSMTLDVEPGLRGEAQADSRLRGWLDAHA